MTLLEGLRLKGRVCYNEPLSKHTTLGIGGPARVWAEAHCGQDLEALFDISGQEGLPIVLFGEGSNLLVCDSPLDIIAVRLKKDFEAFKFTGDRIVCGAGCGLQRFILGAIEEGYSGLEFMAGIPGTLGGSLRMNAGSGAGGPWISDFVKRLKVLDKGAIRYISKAEAGFGYRQSGLAGVTILEAEVKLEPSKDKRAALADYKDFLAEKKQKQELSMASAGCVFKNPAVSKDSAARLIESCSLKGKSIGHAIVSKRHANFIVNTGKATFKDVLQLIDLIIDRVYKEHGVKLDLEVEILHSRDPAVAGSP